MTNDARNVSELNAGAENSLTDGRIGPNAMNAIRESVAALTGEKAHHTDQAAPELCVGCGQPTDGMCWTDCGMSLCGAPLCGDCCHIGEKFGWRHEPRAKGGAA